MLKSRRNKIVGSLAVAVVALCLAWLILVPHGESRVLSEYRGVDTKLIVRLKNALATAQEMHRVLSDDCAKRGHCENHPWDTNWAVVKKVITDSEMALRFHIERHWPGAPEREH